MRLLVLVSAITLLIVASSCSDRFPTETPSYYRPPANRALPRVLEYSHADSVEAGNLAVWYSGQIRPSDSLVSEVLFSLNFLRAVYDDTIDHRDSMPVLRAGRFLAPWRVSEILVKFDDTTIPKVNSGEYHAWDRFEPWQRPAHVDTVVSQWTELRFNGYLHPRRLAELYRTLPGILDAEPNLLLFTDWGTYPIFPRFDGVNWSYVFTGGFLGGRIWFFRYSRGWPVFVGTHVPGDPLPFWWNDALQNGQDFITWDGPH